MDFAFLGAGIGAGFNSYRNRNRNPADLPDQQWKPAEDSQHWVKSEHQ